MYVYMYVCMYVFHLPSIILKIYKFLSRRNDNNSYVCDVKYITAYTNVLLGLRWWGEPEKAPRDAYLH